MTANSTPSPLVRLKRLLDLVDREDRYLREVRMRFFPPQAPDAVTPEWLRLTLDTPEGIDRLESFGAKFARMQDTVVDKLLPQFLAAAGERTGTAIDNLSRAERLGLIGEADEWIAMRRLRNLLVHEYIDQPEEMLLALKKAYTFSEDLASAYRAVRRDVEARWPDLFEPVGQ